MVDAYNNLGNVLFSIGETQQAKLVYQQGIIAEPQHLGSYINLGNLFMSQQQVDEAIAVYESALKLHTNHENLLHNLRMAQHIKDNPVTELYLNFITILQQVGKESDALAVANFAEQLLPDDFAIKLEKWRILPIIYENTAKIDVARSRFIKELSELISQIPLDSPETITNVLKGISQNTIFYLHYQGKNDLSVQLQYGQFVHQVMAANYPEWVKPLPMPSMETDGKIRVGYISNNMRSHVVAQMLIGWLKKHDRNKFKIYSYSINEAKDFRTQEFIIYSDIFRQIPNNLEAVCQQIINDQLHVLVFLDIGMYAMMTQIGALRLAPVQCTTWGHPITSGLPTMDYFLSCELMEPENGEEHYSEKLLKLPNIGLYYEKPLLPETRLEREYFKLRADAVVYLSCQSLYKYLPQYDYIFAAIAQRVPSAQFAFIASQESAAITEKFRQRLRSVFASYGLNSEDYCLILPRLNGVEYTNLNLVSDIYLDTFSWSGGNTTMYAIACNLPIVTFPGEFMRGRHSYAILKMLGVTETIAKDEAEYIEIAVRLGLNPQWRASIVNKIKQNQDRVFEDQTCVAALEEFYQSVVKGI